MSSTRKPLYDQIKEYLYRFIFEALQDGKDTIPSEVALAIQFNVSRTTSRRAIEDLKKEGFLLRKKGSGTYINKHLTEENRELLKSYAIVLNQPAVTTARKTVAVIIPDLKSKYMMGILDGIQTSATKNEWDVIIATSNYDQDLEESLIRKFIPYSHGLIIFPVNKTTYDKEIIKLTLRNYPLVVIDNLLHGVETSSITSDNKKSTYKIVQHFLKAGKKNIGVISNPFDSAISLLERYRGYRDALNEHSIPINKNLILNSLQHYSENSVNDIQNFLIENPLLDAIICFNYELGIKTLSVIKDGFNLLTVKDLFIFDEEFEDFYNLLKYKPNFVKQNPFLIGETAFSIILEKHNRPNNLNRYVVIPEELVFSDNKTTNKS
ncbi:MAG: GntR family transcriptional regulator [Clostridiales bacterium]|nr:GntR family transcriptional regulator [Clostridiales bacterium]